MVCYHRIVGTKKKKLRYTATMRIIARGRNAPMPSYPARSASYGSEKIQGKTRKNKKCHAKNKNTLSTETREGMISL